MADYVVKVIVDPKGANSGIAAVEGSLNGLSNTASRVGSLITRAFAFVGVASGVSSVVGLSDAYTQLQSRLRLVTKGSDELSYVHQRLLNISNKTRASFQDTSKVYARVARSSKELGTSQEELLRFTETLNKAVAISGATSHEANAAMIQLAQGMASGRLQGEELKSVLEQLPRVTQILVDHLDGVDMGNIRQLASDGKITAQDILNAFRAAASGIDEEFSRIEITVSGALTVLSNNFFELVGSTNEANGATRVLTTIIIALADHIQEVTLVLVALAGVISINVVGTAISGLIAGIGAVISGLTSLTAVAVANPFVALLVVAGVMGVALFDLDQKIASLVQRMLGIAPGSEAASAALSTSTKSVTDAANAYNSAADAAYAASVGVNVANTNVAALGNNASVAGQEVLRFTGSAGPGLSKISKSAKDAAEKTKDLSVAAEGVSSATKSTATNLGDAAEATKKLADASGESSKALDVSSSSAASASQSIATLDATMAKASATQQQFAQVGASAWQTYASAVGSSISSLITKFQVLIALQKAAAKAGSAGAGAGAGAGGGGAGGGTAGFASGGSFSVGGRPGVDRNLLALNGKPIAKVSKGEKVNVGRGNGGANGNVSITMNIQTPDADSFRRSQSQIAAGTQRAITRAARRNN